LWRREASFCLILARSYSSLVRIDTKVLTRHGASILSHGETCPKIAVLGVRMHFGMTQWLNGILAAMVFAGTLVGLQNPLRDRLLRNERQQEAVGWYQRADTGAFFLFDRSGAVALLRERDEPNSEVLVLIGNRAAGGGTSFFTDTGREVIRLTALGGATYFPQDAPGGVIAEYASTAGGLVPAPRSSEEVRARAEELVQDLARILDRTISVEYAPAPRAGLGVQYDTLQMVELAFRSLDSARRSFRDLEKVTLTTGPQPAASWTGDTLIIVIATENGYAGRPSSNLIARALQDGNTQS
jgi:hypothetical protein